MISSYTLGSDEQQNNYVRNKDSEVSLRLGLSNFLLEDGLALDLQRCRDSAGGDVVGSWSHW